MTSIIYASEAKARYHYYVNSEDSVEYRAWDAGGSVPADQPSIAKLNYNMLPVFSLDPKYKSSLVLLKRAYIVPDGDSGSIIYSIHPRDATPINTIDTRPQSNTQTLAFIQAQGTDASVYESEGSAKYNGSYMGDTFVNRTNYLIEIRDENGNLVSVNGDGTKLTGKYALCFEIELVCNENAPDYKR